MNRQLKRMLAAGCCALIVILSSIRLLLPLPASGYDAEDCAALAAEILDRESGGDLSGWLSHTLPEKTGLSSSDWYAMISVQRGYDCSAYASALRAHLAANDEPSATSRERMALALIACDASAADSQLCTELLDGSVGKMGIMSWIFALHLINNGVSSAQYSGEQIISELTARQAPDGGWSLAGDFGDPDVTAMTLQAIAPYRDAPSVSEAVGRGMQYLADAQLDSGAYRSFGTENPESTAQVWIALCSLGDDPLTDSRFIKNGHTLLDGILQFRIAPGSYAHTAGGTESSLAAVQTCLALTAEEMYRNGAGSVLLFHGAEPSLPEEPAVTAPPQSDPQSVQTVPAVTESQQTAAAVSASEITGTESAAVTSQTVRASSVCDTTLTTALTAAASAETARTTLPPQDPRSDTEKYPYRIPLTAAVWIIGLILAVICLIRKRRSPKTYLTLAGICAVLTGLIWFIRIESPEQFYQAELKTGGGTVTMEIRCDVICGMPGSEAYPADGVIMPLTEFSIAPDESALELLYDAVKAYTLQIEVDGVSGEAVETAYVRGIASLYEFDFGDLSGWTYTVNGERPSVGCGAYHLQDGDRVVWAYTVSL